MPRAVGRRGGTAEDPQSAGPRAKADQLHRGPQEPPASAAGSDVHQGAQTVQNRKPEIEWKEINHGPEKLEDSGSAFFSRKRLRQPELCPLPALFSSSS